ncbi:zinc transporter 7-like [Sycon ciliatum]|uniref:zinc transporter 7-like n=1 Tax=Sycon ciliatum TaxID=27933 RepID=UPI0020AA5413|eukprot:scpid75267/ scgid10619/ Zinc transporter 5; Solute carrier family 30 member 5; ZnT-like transporter 1
MLPLHKDDSSNKGKKFIPGISILAQATNWVKSFLSKPASRNLFCFLLLNLTFAFVELIYGAWTNSLGLIADSFHMFFDCTALLAGLVATVITRWSPNERFSYGYVRAEVLAGFVNGLFLLFIAFFIFSEAIERAFQPPEVKHDRLMVVSILGFLVNLIGIFAFQHGGAMHGHSHGGDGHGHSHGGHGHSHGEGGSDQQILQGVLLHVMADTLGSVGVIISSFLIQQFGWMMADPICSMCIAVLIAVSVIPLLQTSVGVLMQRAPPSLDSQLDTCYQRVQQIEGVVGVKDPHFWTLCSNVYIGSMRLILVPNVDDVFRVTEQARAIFTQVGVRQLIIQVDKSE